VSVIKLVLKSPRSISGMAIFGGSDGIKIILALLAVYFIWGSTYLALRIAVETFPPFLMSAIRFVIAGGALFVVALLRGTPMPTRRQWLNATLVGGLLLGGGMGGVAFAEQWVASSLAATAVAVIPLWAALFAGLWGRWPGGIEWAGLLLGLTGVALLNMDGGMRANPVGAIALIIAPMCWAFGSIWSRHLSLPGGIMATAVEMLGGALVLLVMSLIFGENLREMPSEASLLALIYLIIFGSLVAFSAYMYLLGRVRASLATSYAYVNPVVAVVLGVLLAGEQIGLPGIAAMIIILAGVALLMIARERRS
jgi:drug/metabolite transporter (DMT)-like permease